VPTDTILTIYCPYCMDQSEFILLTAYKDGRFVCIHCAHTVRPGVVNYSCVCPTCVWLFQNGKLPSSYHSFSDAGGASLKEKLLLN